MRIIVIPAYCEASVIASVVRDAARVAERVVVVDDGSVDRTADEALHAGAVVVRHAINRGVGGAVGTGIIAARRLGATAIVTMDADGQHRAADAERLFARLAQGDVDFVIGSRLLPGYERGRMPRHRVLLNGLGNGLTSLLFGVRVTDSQSGMRGLGPKAFESLDLRTNGMESNSEMVANIRSRNWRFIEIPIPAIYTEYSLSKGQSIGGGFRTAAKLISRRFLG